MGNTSSILTQYDIEEVQGHCTHACEAVSQQDIVSLYNRFCQLDRNRNGFISSDEFLSVPEFAVNPLSQVSSQMLDGLNFKDVTLIMLILGYWIMNSSAVMFKVYDLDCNEKVNFKYLMSVLRDLTGSFMTEQQREVRLLRAAGSLYFFESYFLCRYYLS
ncbi:hypothetical protein KSP40_PGU008917 [Platanthera guangdongensis]|uniref:EF-hand domain-containing protein n=1 Tax=Platanthera guangdongensis TaxID=2320717 RepID=A0ABR2N034_9ASPA